MNTVGCVLTKYNRYTNLSFIETGTYCGKRLTGGCLVIPKAIKQLENKNSVIAVRECFIRWFQDVLLLGTMGCGNLTLERELERGYFTLNSNVKGNSYEVCMFIEFNDSFSYRYMHSKICCIKRGDMLVILDERYTTLANYCLNYEEKSFEKFVHSLEKCYIEALDKNQKSTFFVIVGDQRCRGKIW